MKIMHLLPVVAALPLAGCGTKTSPERPNVIFILSDDHTWQSIGAYGSIYREICPTPHIDRIAAEGALFTNAFCTNSISGPSRATILTGKYSHMNGYVKNYDALPFDSTQMTFPRIMQQHGYTTAMVGKWHLQSTPVGFDYYKYHTLGGEQGVYWNPVWNENGTLVPERGYATTLTADAAMKWLDGGRDKSKPFCLLYHFKAPHRPWERDSCYVDLFEGVEMPYPASFYDDYRTRELTAGNTEMTILHHMTPNDVKLTPPEGLTPQERNRWLSRGVHGDFWTPSDTLRGVELQKWKYQRYIKDYLATAKSVDDQVGRLLDYLRETGLDKNTIVIYCGDQGFYLGEHGWFDKRFMYEESLRMPFMVRWPGRIEAGKVVDGLITNVDFAPTLLDMCGLEADPAMQGKVYTQTLLGGESQPVRTSVYYHYYEYPFWHHVQPHYGIRTDRYKLIHFYYDVDVWELYDLEKDPHELRNVYGDPAYGAIREAMHAELLAQQAECGDTGTLEEFRAATR